MTVVKFAGYSLGTFAFQQTEGFSVSSFSVLEHCHSFRLHSFCSVFRHPDLSGLLHFSLGVELSAVHASVSAGGE